jgi:hypothetical protein
VEHLAHLDAAPRQLVARGLDVGDDQEHLRGAGHGGREVRAKVNRARGARRRELDHVFLVRDEVGVEPPAEGRVELLRSVDIRDGNGDDLELHVDLPDTRVAGSVAPAYCGRAHG